MDTTDKGQCDGEQSKPESSAASSSKCDIPESECCGKGRGRDYGTEERSVVSADIAKTLRTLEKAQTAKGSGTQSSSGHASYSSSDSNSCEDTISKLKISSQEHIYVNISSGKSFLAVELKSAVYSRGYLSIWVKINYHIYERLNGTDWLGLYSVGECFCFVLFCFLYKKLGQNKGVFCCGEES